MNPGLQSRFVDQRTCSSGGLRKTRPTGADGRAGSRRRPGRRSSRRRTAVCASSLARCMPMQTCGPARRRRGAGGRSRGARRSGRGRRTTLGSRLAAATEHRDEVAAGGSATPPSSTSAGRVAIDHRRRGLEPQRLLDRVGAAGPAVHRHEGELGRVGEQVHDARWRSCPRSSRSRRRCMTAALEMTASRSRPPAASASSDDPGPRSSAGPMAACSSANAARPAAGTSPPAVTSVTAATIASYQPRTAPVPASDSPSEWVDDRGRERAGEGAPQLGRARRARWRRRGGRPRLRRRR